MVWKKLLGGREGEEPLLNASGGFCLVHIKEELQQLFGCPVDIVRLRDNMNELLKRSIIEEGIYA